MKSKQFLDNNGKAFSMEFETYVRWMCLLEAIESISSFAKKNNIDLDVNKKWTKNVALNRYIHERYPSMLHDLTVEESITIYNQAID